jgi:hypothetical protein
MGARSRSHPICREPADHGISCGCQIKSSRIVARFHGSDLGVTVTLRKIFFIIAASLLALAPAYAQTKAHRTNEPSNTTHSSQQNVPSDFELIYSKGPAHADWGGGVRIRLDHGGAYVVERQAGRGAEAARWVTKAKGSLKAEQLNEVYHAIDQNSFWDLSRQYRDPGIRDGYVRSLRIRAGGRVHWVVMSNTSVPQVEAIVSVLRSALPKRHRVF